MSAQTVLVTGSSSGMGLELTRGLLNRGYTVFATMRNIEGANADQAAQLRSYAREQSGTLHLVELDVTDDNSVTNAINHVVQEAGKLDVVINNAGIGGGGYTEAFTVEQFKNIFDVNVFGVQRIMRAVLPALRVQRSGLIINISSLQGRVIVPFAGAYTASKFALEGLAETYRYELSPLGIDVVIVEPGGFLTGYWSKLIGPADGSRTSGYAPHADLPDTLWNGVIAGLQSELGPDTQVLVSEVIKLIETPAGQRPVRTVVDPMLGGAAPTAVNQASEPAQNALLQALGMGDRVSVQ